MAVASVCVVLVAGSSAAALAQQAPKNPPTLAATGSMRDALMRLGEGTDVELTLANGKSYRGKLGTVGDHAVIVTELAGKEFYDALIRLEDVSSIEVRTRGLK